MTEARLDRDLAVFGRRLARGRDRAVLATSLGGWPYASLVLVTLDHDASPLLLLSDLARHSRNIAAEPRVSLLLDATEGRADPLTGPRLTLLGQARTIADERRLARFVAHHPASALYAGFADFRLYRLEIERGHLVAGFGRIDWIDGGDFRFAPMSEELAAAEAGMIEHLNRDHEDAVALYAHRLLGRAGSGWRLTGIDPEGADLRCHGETARLDFAVPVLTPGDALARLTQLVDEKRQDRLR